MEEISQAGQRPAAFLQAPQVIAVSAAPAVATLLVGTAQGAGQEQAGCLPPRNRGLAGQRLNPEVHRPALSHHRGQPAPLAKKTRPKNITTALSLIKFYGTL